VTSRPCTDNIAVHDPAALRTISIIIIIIIIIIMIIIIRRRICR